VVQGKRNVPNHRAREFSLDELQVLIGFYAFLCFYCSHASLITIVLKETSCTHNSYE